MLNKQNTDSKQKLDQSMARHVCWMSASFSPRGRELNSVDFAVKSSHNASTQLGLPGITHRSIDNIYFQTIRYH